MQVCSASASLFLFHRRVPLCRILLSTCKWYHVMFVSLSDLLHLVTVSLGPCMLLQMALFHSFLWLSSIPLCVCVYPLHVLYLFMFNGNLGCFYALAIVNSAAVSVGVHVSFWIRVLLKYIPRSGISGYMATLFLFFWEKYVLFFLVLHQFTFPPTI